MVTIEVFYSFQNIFCHLALDEIYALNKDYDVELLWQPFSAKAAGQSVPLANINPDKISYIIEDAKRYAKMHNIPLTIPTNWPEEEFDPVRITRGAMVAKDMDFLMEYNFKVFDYCWTQERNPNTEEFWRELCDEMDVEMGEFVSKLSSPDIRERVKGIYTRGKNLGIFDTPTFVINKERFVGIDKLHQIREILTKIAPK
ncbi:MAG: DsbA family protein [Bdellovibrionota bacterium]